MNKEDSDQTARISEDTFSHVAAHMDIGNCYEFNVQTFFF